MNNVSFKIRTEEMLELFRNCNLYKSDLSFDKVRTVKDRRVSNIKDYNDYYQKIISRTEYDLLLQDDSIIQINRSVENEKVVYRYLYMQPAYKIISFAQYCESCKINIDDVSLYEYARECYESEGRTDNDFPCYVRYDADEKGYQPLLHSYAHIHIGFNSEMRIPTRNLWTPAMFGAFVIRHVYPIQWEELLSRQNNQLSFKRICEKLSEKQWSSIEETDVYIL